jgi:hypothetical protein
VGGDRPFIRASYCAPVDIKERFAKALAARKSADKSVDAGHEYNVVDVFPAGAHHTGTKGYFKHILENKYFRSF